MISLTCGILKSDTNELIYKADSQSSKANVWLLKGKVEGRDNRNLDLTYTHYYIKNRYSTGNSTYCNNLEKQWIYVCA